jgi:hypothetical protein
MTMHTPLEPTDRSRRRWLAGCVRYSVLGGLSLLSAGLVVRSLRSPGAAGCPRNTACRDCTAWSGCQRAEALSARQEKG